MLSDTEGWLNVCKATTNLSADGLVAPGIIQFIGKAQMLVQLLAQTILLSRLRSAV